MVSIKSYIDIEQSRKLAEILPLESADMLYYYVNKSSTPSSQYPFVRSFKEKDTFSYLPCWSLAALLGIVCEVKRMDYSDKWEAASWNKSTTEQEYYVDVEGYDNPVDACVALIEKLHELKLL